MYADEETAKICMNARSKTLEGLTMGLQVSQCAEYCAINMRRFFDELLEQSMHSHKLLVEPINSSTRNNRNGREINPRVK